jgi:hypothetical protein
MAALFAFALARARRTGDVIRDQSIVGQNRVDPAQENHR